MRLSSRTASFLVTLSILAIDFVTKRIVLAEIDTFQRGIPLIEGLLRFTYVRNAGAAFGMFQGARWPFVIVSGLAVVGLTVLLWKTHTRGLRRFSYAMILAGAAGNLVDRVFYQGLVVDFIEMRWQEHVFPVYNVADMGVSIGAALLVISMLREKDEEPAIDPDSGTTPGTEADGSTGDGVDESYATDPRDHGSA